jgi:GMP synthase-like glutamine amidotransferase
MKPRRLWIVDPALYHAEDQGCGVILHGWPGESRIFRPALVPGDGPGPQTGHATDGVVILGSAASVHDPAPWLARLADWMRPLLDGRVRLPVLGICFGHQLIGHCAGAEVGFVRGDRAKLLGVAETRIAASRLLDGPRTLRVLVSHREEVKRCPEGYRVVAERDGVALDGLEHASLPVFSFQFHPEAREQFAERQGLDPDLLDARLRADSRRLLEAFQRLVLSQ